MARPQVLLGLLMTALGFAGVFTVFTYIQPLLMRVSGFAETSVSAILLVFGAGLIAGNVLGGRLADRRLVPALLGTLAALAIVLALMTFAIPSQPAAMRVHWAAWCRGIRNGGAASIASAAAGARRW